MTGRPRSKSLRNGTDSETSKRRVDPDTFHPTVGTRVKKRQKRSTSAKVSAQAPVKPPETQVTPQDDFSSSNEHSEDGSQGSQHEARSIKDTISHQRSIVVRDSPDSEPEKPDSNHDLRNNDDPLSNDSIVTDNGILRNQEPAKEPVDLLHQGLFSRILKDNVKAETANLSGFDPILPSLKTAAKRLKHNDYTVGWICALPTELIAARAMLDEEHLPLSNSSGDQNAYKLGAIGNHNVVITCIRTGVYGLTSATAAAIAMASTYPNSVIRPLLVGIAGGAPSHNDIRLGDVVIGTPSSTHPAIHQYDSGKTTEHGILKTAMPLNKPAAAWLNTLSLFQSDIAFKMVSVSTHVLQALQVLSSHGFSHPGTDTDILHHSECEHPGESCPTHRLSRVPRQTSDPVIHFGCIASGNQVIKHARTRDRIATESSGILCFETEAAGIVDYMPCLVIRGICDYCDVHKAKYWQGYSALAAAAVAKALLLISPTNDPDVHILNVDATEGQAQGRRDENHPNAFVPSDGLLGIAKKSDQRLLRRRQILQALAFQNQDTRRATIKEAHNNTCKWLFRQPQLCEWTDPTKYDKHHGILWMKGKPGTGKSTVMKHLVEHVEEFHPNSKNITVASFFFNARGEELGRTTVGMYRSLLGQIFERLPVLQSLLDRPELDPVLRSSSWTVEILEDLLRHVIKGLGSTSLVLFIDALDECPETQIREMVHLLAKLPELASKNHVHICFASRHYPHVSIPKGYEFALERQLGHTEDILRYLDTEFTLEDPILTADLKQRMLAKSGQIFLWIVLVVQIMKREYDHGRVHELSTILDSIPDEVGELFRGILTRDSENLPQLQIAMQWVLYAQRPLRLEELYHAMLYASPTSRYPLPARSVPFGDMYRYVLSCSKGLLEQTASTDARIQFIHETVREFLLEPRGLQDFWPGFEGLREHESHEFLKRSCVHYMEQAERMSPTRPLEEQSLCQIGEREQRFPFISYAGMYILHHAERANVLGISQADFIKTFDNTTRLKVRKMNTKHAIEQEAFFVLRCLDPLSDELRIGVELATDGLLQLYTHWVASFEPGSKWDTVLPPLLIALLSSLRRPTLDLMETHKIIIKSCAILIEKDYQHRNLAGFIQQRPEALYHMLGKKLANPRVRSHGLDIFKLREKMDSVLDAQVQDAGYLARRLNENLIEAVLDTNYELLEECVQLGADTNTQDSFCGNAALHHLIEDYGGRARGVGPASYYVRFIKKLQTSGADINLKGRRGKTPLHMAAEHGFKEAVQYLLEQQACTTVEDDEGKTPMAYATDPEVISMLQEACEKDKKGPATSRY